MNLKRKISGVLLLNKPKGLSSNAALVRAKRALNADKAGHTGTLDPMASGLLPLCFGEATKFASDLLDADKAYRATLKLGVTTTSGDAEGEVLNEYPVNVTFDDLSECVQSFLGDIEQIPPMYSALKRDGKPLYEYARAGITLERKPRRVTIRNLELRSFDGLHATLDVACTKGTYIRTLAEDIGRCLGCGAHLTALERTQVGGLRIEQAISLDDFELLTLEQREKELALVDALLNSLGKINLDEIHSTRFLQGQRLQLSGRTDLPSVAPRVRVYGLNRSQVPQSLLGIAELREDGVLAPIRLIAE